MAVKKSNSTSFLNNINREYSFKVGCNFDNLEDKSITYTTPYPIVNLALSGDFFGGIQNHKLYMLGGLRSSFKSNLALVLASSILASNNDAYCLFYDSESIATKNNFNKAKIRAEQVVEPRSFSTIDKLSELVLNDTKNIIQSDECKDRQCVMVIDGVGLVGESASIEKALDGDPDKQPAQKAKALARLASHLTTIYSNHNVIVIILNHIYKEIGVLYPRSIFKGGEGLLMSSHTSLLMTPKNLGSDKDKETNTAEGRIFTLQTAKSRSIIQDFKMELEVSYTGGINPWSGLFDLLERMTNYLVKPSSLKYSLINNNGEVLSFNNKLEFKKNEVENDPNFWRLVFSETDFNKEVQKRILLDDKPLIDEKALESLNLLNSMKSVKVS